MEGAESILDSIYEEDNVEDVEMVDIEEGEFVEENPNKEQGQSTAADVNVATRESESGNHRPKRNRKNRNRKRKSSSAPHTDINRFVLETCKRLKEKKSYMVYTAVGCLGASALSDLIKEVDAIQACGGQMTADGKRHRSGGGILWSIIKTREPKAFKEIMKRAKEFEKQFSQVNIRKGPEQNRGASQGTTHAVTDNSTGLSDGSQLVPQMQSHPNPNNSNDEEKRVSVYNRIRVPVSYDDLLGEDSKDVAT